MPDKDEFAELFGQMKEHMHPSPYLVAHVNAVAAGRVEGETHAARGSEGSPVGTPAAPVSTPVGKPVTPRRLTARAKRGLGVLSGGVASVVLVGAMLAGGVGSPVVTTMPGSWPTPVVVGAGTSGPATTDKVDAGAYAEIYQALLNADQWLQAYATGNYTTQASGGAKDMSGSVVLAGGAPTSSSTYEYASAAGTNVQVAGIDEGDIVKTDGSYLYVAQGRQVKVVAAAGAESRVVAVIDVGGFTSGTELTGAVVDIMIDGHTLVVLAHAFATDTLTWSRQSANYLGMGATGLIIGFFDISDPTQPVFLSTLRQSGTYTNSRLMDGVLYLISSYSVPADGVDPNDPSTYVPVIGGGGVVTPIAPRDVYILPGVTGAAYSLVTAIDVAGRSIVSDQAVLGWTDTVYMSESNLYLGSSRWWVMPLASGEDGGKPVPGMGEGYEGSRTDLVRIALNDGHLAVAATATIAGTLVNQFALDESNGYLRVATTWQDSANKMNWVTNSGLWILDEGLNVVGSIPELVTNESVQSVRFDGNVAYVVTYRQMDPLFTIDVTDPTNPVVQGALKIPGFSTYLHPLGNGLLLGIGVDTQAVADGKSSAVGLKVSMFDVSDPYNVREWAVTPVDANDTEVSWDHKAAFIDQANGLIGFPTQSWTYDNITNTSSFTWDYRLYKWTGGDFQALGRYVFFDGPTTGMDPLLQDTFTRGVRIGGDLYVTTATFVAAYSLDDYHQVAQVQLS